MTSHHALRRKFVILLGVAIGAPNLIGADASDRPAPLAEFDIANDGGGLFVPVSVGGRELPFFVDTASNDGDFDTSLRHLLGPLRKKERVMTASRPIEVEYFDQPEAMLGTLTLRSAADAAPLVGCRDLSDIELIAGRRPEGVLGWPVLSRYVVRLDFDRGKIAFLTSPGNDAGMRVPIHMINKTPLVRAMLPGMSAARSMFIIDTGLLGHAGSLHAEIIRDLEERRMLTAVRTVKTADAGGGGVCNVFKVTNFELAGFKHDELFFLENLSDIPCRLGLGYWSRYIVTFDFPNRVLYLKPSKRFALPAVDCGSGAARAGMQFNRRKGQNVVARVAVGGAAEAAGVAVGDVLLEVNGISVKSARLFAVHALLDTSMEICRITVLRGSQEKRLLIDMRPQRDDVHQTGAQINRIGPPTRRQTSGTEETNRTEPLLQTVAPSPDAK